MKKHYSLTVAGSRSTWAFTVSGSPQDADDWRRDGLRVDEIINTIPEWWPLPVRWWCLAEDAFRLRWVPWWRS